jgi:hypothetical protein
LTATVCPLTGKSQSEQRVAERQVRIVISIDQEGVFPFLLHELDFPLESLLVGFRILRAAAGMFVMVKLRLRRIDDPITARAQLEAEIDVIESDL